MTPTEYVERSAATAIYPRDQIAYPFLGLVGEVGELLTALTKPDQNEILAESGDVCWYLAAICRDVGLSAEEVFTATTHPEDDPVIYLGAICELVKKVMRDDYSVWSDLKRGRLLVQLRRIAGLVVMAVTAHGSTLEQVMLSNIAKLESRQARGALQGSGNNR